MANDHRGKFLLLYLIVVVVVAISLDFRALAESNPVLLEVNDLIGENTGACNVLDRKEAQIERLEEIVKNLTELVHRLEMRFSDGIYKISEQPPGDTTVENKRNEQIVIEDESDSVADRRDSAKSLLKKFDPFWSDKFQFVSGVRLNTHATSVNLLPFKDYEGLSKYFAVGDNKGKVYVFLKSSDVVVEFSTLSDSPITAMLSYFSAYKNNSILVTGHKNGLVLMHRVWEDSSGEDLVSVHMENFEKITDSDIEESGSPITILEVHYVGRTRYILSTDTIGKLKIFKENGALYGSVVPTSKPIVFLKQRLLFLTETGAGSLDLRTMTIKETKCEGLNNSYIENYVFDVTERSKAYGFASDGDLVQVLLLGDITNFKCRVRYKRKFNIHRPLSVQAIKGFLLIVNQEKVFLYNVSSPHYVRSMSPKLAFSASLDDVRSYFIKDNSQEGPVIPLLACDKEKLVILGLGGGYVGVYQSSLPINKGEYKTMFWSSPVLIFVLFLFGAWQFFAKKKEVLTSWGPDDQLNTATITNGAQLESSSRSGEAMELRGGVLRSRRYVSPTRYPGGSSNSFRPPTQDTNLRPPAADTTFRASTEVKFRGSNAESVGFAKRRENVFVNSQVMDDST